MRRLLIIYHSQSGNTARMAQSALEGAQEEEGVTVVFKRAFDANINDLLACDGLLIATPENFGYMSGAIKDFFDRTYYPAEGKTVGRPYALLVSAGNDGSGAVREIGRIATGYGWKLVADPIVARGPITADTLDRCRELGAAMASGIALGIF
ncbi:flavodoxin [Denitratisoma sp. DHT3]|uniref:flavodoxin family protein n=1 Tax=Denitratisoma sp. DHT3 TaxID=1981880 RepID=UPI0011985447|nr:flavodoxin family protein [Denitratisoma sp. DHT3]QDX79826.1 flavodoxin [Denitratisoma sp. DHT3]